MLSAIDVWRNGELISILSLAIAPAPPLAGDERKNNGDEEGSFCREARAVPSKFNSCADADADAVSGSLDGACAEPGTGLFANCSEFRVECTGVAEERSLFDRRETGEDIVAELEWLWFVIYRVDGSGSG